MNIFTVNRCPIQCAKELPDKLTSKMAVETCQMLAICLGPKYLNYGYLPKKDGSHYSIDNTHNNHPNTKWIRKNPKFMAWAIVHAFALLAEHKYRFGTMPSTIKAVVKAKRLFEKRTGYKLSIYRSVKESEFVRSMPDDLKYNTNISNTEAYRRFMSTKPYAKVYSKTRPMPLWMKVLFDEQTRNAR